jgi:hypothetical protein
MSERITIELTRNEWIALLAAAFYGSDVLEKDIGGRPAGVADQVVEQLKTKLSIHSIRDEATKLESLANIFDQVDVCPDCEGAPDALPNGPCLRCDTCGRIYGTPAI